MLTATERHSYSILVTETMEALNTRLGASCPTPKVFWDVRGKTRLGYARGYTEIHLNLQYAKALSFEKYSQTVVHELCHSVTTWRRVVQHGLGHRSSGVWSSHGPQWQKAMRVMGRKPERCSTVAAEVADQIKPARRQVRYSCLCGCTEGHEVTAQILKKITAGSRYRCLKCKQTIVIPRSSGNELQVKFLLDFSAGKAHN